MTCWQTVLETLLELVYWLDRLKPHHRPNWLFACEETWGGQLKMYIIEPVGLIFLLKCSMPYINIFCSLHSLGYMCTLCKCPYLSGYFWRRDMLDLLHQVKKATAMTLNGKMCPWKNPLSIYCICPWQTGSLWHELMKLFHSDQRVIQGKRCTCGSGKLAPWRGKTWLYWHPLNWANSCD